MDPYYYTPRVSRNPSRRHTEDDVRPTHRTSRGRQSRRPTQNLSRSPPPTPRRRTEDNVRRTRDGPRVYSRREYSRSPPPTSHRHTMDDNIRQSQRTSPGHHSRREGNDDYNRRPSTRDHMNDRRGGFVLPARPRRHETSGGHGDRYRRDYYAPEDLHPPQHYTRDERRSQDPFSRGETYPIPRHEGRGHRYGRHTFGDHREASGPDGDDGYRDTAEPLDYSLDGDSEVGSHDNGRQERHHRDTPRDDAPPMTDPDKLERNHAAFIQDVYHHADTSHGQSRGQESIDNNDLFEHEGIISRCLNGLRLTPEATGDYMIFNVSFDIDRAGLRTDIQYHGREDPKTAPRSEAVAESAELPEHSLIEELVDSMTEKHSDIPWEREMSLREMGQVRKYIESSAKRTEKAHWGEVATGSIQLYRLVESVPEEWANDPNAWQHNAWFKMAPKL